MSKSNTEIAEWVAKKVYYAEPYPHDEVGTVPKTAPIIEAALTTAQSDLARKVLEEIEINFVNVRVDSNAFQLWLRDLFTRLQIDIT